MSLQNSYPVGGVTHTKQGDVQTTGNVTTNVGDNGFSQTKRTVTTGPGVYGTSENTYSEYHSGNPVGSTEVHHHENKTIGEKISKFILLLI